MWGGGCILILLYSIWPFVRNITLLLLLSIVYFQTTFKGLDGVFT